MLNDFLWDYVYYMLENSEKIKDLKILNKEKSLFFLIFFKEKHIFYIR